MGRGSKIKHIEKNGYSKFKQVLVKKEDKKSSKEKPGTSKGQEDKAETPEIPQKLQKSNKFDDHEGPKKSDELQKQQNPEESQVKIQETPETSKRREMPKEQRVKRERPERPKKSENPKESNENESYEKPDEVEKSQRPEGLQVKSQGRPETFKEPETAKGPDIPKIIERSEIPQKSEIINTPDEHENSKKTEEIVKSQRPEGPDISQERSETLKKPETPKGKRKKKKRQERSQKFESPNRPDENESQRMPDGVEKSQKPEGSQVKCQERSETNKELQMTEGLEKPKITQKPEIPQKSGSSDAPHEYESLKKPDGIEKSQGAEGFDNMSQEKAKAPQRPETPKEQRKKAKWQERSQKCESYNRSDENVSQGKPDGLDKSQGSQVKSQERPETNKEPEMTKGPEIPKITERPKIPQKSENSDMPYEYESHKKSQRQEGFQIKSQERPEISKRPEIPKGQWKKAKWQERSQRIESFNRPYEHENHKKLDGLEKFQKPEAPQVKSQEMPVSFNRTEMPKGQRKNTKWPEQPQRFENPNRPNEYDSSKKAYGLEKSQRPDVPRVKSQERLEPPKWPKTTKGPETLKNTIGSEKPSEHGVLDKTKMPVKPEKIEKSESSKKLENEKLEKIENVPERIKHPLEHSWGLWLITNDKRNWEDNLVKLTIFDTIEDYWCLYHHIKPPSELERGKDYAVFKDELRPMWEDGANRQGGRWLINFDKRRNEQSDLDNIWMFVVLLAIGENFHVPNSICGAVVSLRAKNRIAVWVPNYRNEHAVKHVGITLRDTLGLRGRLSFQQHNTTTSIFTL